MTTDELNRYVSEQFAQGRTEKQIAQQLGISLECMYRKMAKNDESKDEKKA